MARLSHSTTYAIRMFSYYLANRTLSLPLLEEIDYGSLFAEPSAFEQTYAIIANVLELDADGAVIDSSHAEYRAAQYIRSYFDRAYRVDPPFEDWEVELH